MSETTPAERALLDYVLKNAESITKLPDLAQAQLTDLAEAVRAEQTWDGAVTEDEARKRYPSAMFGGTTAAKALVDLNRARADGIRWVTAHARVDANKSVHDVLDRLVRLLPKEGAE